MKMEIYAAQNSSIVLQHCCENRMDVRKPWGQVPIGKTALLCASLLWPAVVCSSKLSWGNAVFRPQRKGKMFSQSQRGAHLYRQESPRLVPDWSVLMQIRAPNFSLVQKALFYLV